LPSSPILRSLRNHFANSLSAQHARADGDQLVSGGALDLRKGIESQEVRISELSEVIKQFQSDLRKDIQALIQLEALNNMAPNAPRLPPDGQAEYDKNMARLTERYSGQ